MDFLLSVQLHFTINLSKNLKYNTIEKVAKALGKKIQIKFV